MRTILNKKGLGAVILLSMLGTMQMAQGAYISVTGSFNDPSASDFLFYNKIYNQDDDSTPAQSLPDNIHAATDSVAYFGWGVDVTDSLDQFQIIQSHFWFNGTGSVDGGGDLLVNMGTPFSLGSFTYTNEQTILSGGLVNIDFQMDINIDGNSLLPVEYRLAIDNTANDSSDPNDTARLISTPLDLALNIDGTNYLLSFNGFSRDGGSTFETIATLPEGEQTSAEIFATLTAVPVPAAVWLFGSALIGLAGFARRK